jgi:uncharacterized protein YbaA (DUF1428 family)
VIPIRKRSLPAYQRMARMAGKIWKEHGALEHRECVGDDLSPKGVPPFGKRLRLQRGETVLFSWIVYQSRAHRDRVNAKVMQDPRIGRMMGDGSMPFDPKRMMYGGFKVFVDL